MSKTTKTIIAFIMACCAIPAGAGAIHTWAQGATITAADLNANLQHIHNLMVGGHGARLVDADVNGSANIALTKLNFGTKSLITAYSRMSATCNADPCTLTVAQVVTGINWLAQGEYCVHIPTTSSAYSVTLTSTLAGSDCYLFDAAGTCPLSTTAFPVTCEATTTAVHSDARFTTMMVGGY